MAEVSLLKRNGGGAGAFFYQAFIVRPHMRKRVCLAPRIEAPNKDVSLKRLLPDGLQTRTNRL